MFRRPQHDPLDEGLNKAELFQEDDDLEEPSSASDLPAVQIIEMINELEDIGQVLLIKQHLETMTENVSAERLDLNKIAAEQFILLRTLSAEMMSRAGVRTSDKTSTMNALQRAITQLINIQDTIYNIDRVKALESALNQTLKGHPEGAKLMETFSENFERMIGSRVKLTVGE